MALNIPNTDLPGNSFLKGVDTGSTMFSRLMQPVLEREKQKQQAEQFAQELALKKKQEARLGANSGLNSKILQQQLLKLQHSNDPAYEIQQLQQMMQALGGGKQSQPQGMQQQPMPTQEEGEGVGMFSPEGLQEAQQQAPEQSTQPNMPGQGGIDMEAIKNSPILRGYFKKHFGIDPGVENKASSSLGKVLADLKQAKTMGAPEEQIKQLEQYAQRLAEGNPGVNLSVDPTTGAINFTSGGRGSQANQQQVINGQVISKPTTAVSTDQQKLQLAAIAREQALKHVEQPYLGAGASFQMASDLTTYATSKDPKAKKEAGDRLVKAAVSEKIVPEIANLQITSQGGKATVHALEKQEESIRQGWPNFGKKLAGNLPKDLQDRVVEEHNQRLKDISDIRKKYFVKGLPVDLNEHKTEAKQEKPVPISQEDKNYANIVSGQLIDVLPKATPENIINTAKQTGKSVSEVIEHLVAQAARMRGGQ